jgi:hypothetical protein
MCVHLLRLHTFWFSSLKQHGVCDDNYVHALIHFPTPLFNLLNVTG